MSALPTPDGKHHPTLTAAIAVQGGFKALDFYKNVFGAQEILRVPGSEGKLIHAQLRIGDSLLFVSDEEPSLGHRCQAPQAFNGTTFVLYLHVDDADATYARAVAAGAEAVFPVKQQDWGNREGVVRDPFGHLWALASHSK